VELLQTELKQNKWKLGYVLNQRSQMIVDFMEFSEYKTLDDLINIPVEIIEKLLDNYESYLNTKYRTSTIQGKLNALEYFYNVNGYKFKKSKSRSYERVQWMDEGVPVE